ncbi:hypothetical protein ANAEL_00997 [Anaerolineales bacterium]|nr:hypothetical protein ANAEL_00997 [Anaerolineales bacterium]
MPEIQVTVIVLRPNNSGGYDESKFPGVTINTQAPDTLVLQEIIRNLKGFKIDLDINNVEMFLQGPSGSALDHYTQNGSRIIIMPKYIAPPVKFPQAPA